MTRTNDDRRRRRCTHARIVRSYVLLFILSILIAASMCAATSAVDPRLPPRAHDRASPWTHLPLATPRAALAALKHATASVQMRAMEAAESSTGSSDGASRLISPDDAASSCTCVRLLSTRVLLVSHGALDTSPLWQAVRNGFFEAGKLVGVETEAIFLTSDQLVNQFGNSAIRGLNTILDQQYARYMSELAFPSVLITSIVDAQQQQSRILKFVDAGVKIITYNGDSDDADLLRAVMHFSSNEDLAGRQSGVRFAQAGVQRAACLIPDTLATNVVQRCSGFMRAFLNLCTGSECMVERLLIPTASASEAKLQLESILRNATFDGLLIVGPAVTQRALPMLALDEFRQVGRRVAVFDFIDERMYRLLDEQILFFAVDTDPWLQGFMPVIFASYLVHTGQRLASVNHTSTFMKTGPIFVAARSVSGRARPSVLETHLDVVTHTKDTPFWSNFQSGVRLAARQLGLKFRDCTNAPDESVCSMTTAQPNSLRYYSPAISLDVGSMANFLNRAGEQGSNGVVTTLPSTQVLTEPVRRLVTGGIPVLSANTGDETFVTMGTLAHVSMPEYEAGYEAGVQAVAYGAVRGMCLQTSRVNGALTRRCAGFQAGMLFALNAIRSPWMPSAVVDYDSITTAVVADLLADDPAGVSLILSTLLAKPDINFILTMAGTMLSYLATILESTGRFNSSTTDPTAFQNQPGREPLRVAAVNPPPFPYASSPLQPLLLGTFDCGPVAVSMINAHLLTFCVDQQESMQGFLPTFLLGVRVLTGHMINPASPILYPTGPNIINAGNIADIECAHRQLCDDELVHAPIHGSSEMDEDADLDRCPVPSYATDGWCDEMNNVPGCWDGGDCCDSTCQGGPAARAIRAANRNISFSPLLTFQCGTDSFGTGWNAYSCLNPSAIENTVESRHSRDWNSGGFIALYVAVSAIMLLLCTALVVGGAKWRGEKRARRIDRRNREVAEAQTRAQSAFLAHMSHEIRSPLHGILGMGNLLAATALNDEQREYALAIEKSSMHLLGVVNDILDFSRLESGHLDLNCTIFSIRGLVEDSFDMVCGSGHSIGMEMMHCMEFHPAFFRDDAGHERNDVTVPYVRTQPTGSGWPEPLFYGDEQRIRQILVNLLAKSVSQHT
jgi:ABC-type sugar transport system substrate-binding protein